MRGLCVARAVAFAAALAASLYVKAAPVTPARIAELCGQAESPAHCGRLIEADQLKGLPNLATRDGLTLKVLLYPSGTHDFVDVESLHGDKTWSLWDYWSALNAVVLFTTDDDRLGYAILRRATGQVAMLPAEPVLSPDRQRLAIADFCATGCDNEVTVWQVTRDSLRRELVWKSDAAAAAPWTDVSAQWKDAETLTIEFTPKGEDKPRSVERRLADPQWQRYGARGQP
jgi:hypothetical protein